MTKSTRRNGPRGKSRRVQPGKVAPAQKPTRVAKARKPSGAAHALAAKLAEAERALDVARTERDEAVARAGALWGQSRTLWKLHVASTRLHESLERQVLFQVIEEIVNAIVGSEELAIYERDHATAEFRLAAQRGIAAARLRIEPGLGVIGRAVASGETWVREDGGESVPGEEELTACIPLQVGSDVVGAIGIFRLLPQKGTLDGDDYQLFQLLRTQAAVALRCASETASA